MHRSSLVIVALGFGLLHVISAKTAKRLRLVKLNFLGKEVYASYGILLFADVLFLTSVGMIAGVIDFRRAILYLWVMGAMCLLGLVDDLFGTREVGGFRGHFKKLICERKLTTGVVKAVGGALVGVVAGREIYSNDLVRWISCALLVALGANFLNILDLRPGRAVSVFLFAIVVIWCVSIEKAPHPWLVASILVPTVVWGIFDSRGKAMMGDSGSNCLGALLGLSVAIGMSLPIQIVVICVLVAIHWYSERHSITKLIEGNRFLRAIDARLGVR